MENFNPICSKCNTPLIRKEGKNGVYFACPNWQKNGSGCEGEIIFPPKETPKSGRFQKATGGGDIEVLDALRKIWVEIEELRKEFKEFVRIFGGKEEK